MTALISLRDAVVTYDGPPSPALDGVSVDVGAGAWIAVAGGNGSGKSTLLAAIAGVLPLRAGRVERHARRVAMLMQDPDNQLVSSSVAGELSLSIDKDARDRDARIEEAIERFALAALLDRNPHRLSGGEKQRLAMATVWLEAPDVLLLDEPLAYLDSDNRERVLGFVRELNADGTAVVWATPGEDVAFAKEALVLDAGRVVFNGPAVDAPTEKAFSEPLQTGRASSGEPDDVFRMENVAFAYDGAPVIDGVDLHAASGERVGIFGPNSAGKSTLLLVAGGALAPSSGRVIHPATDAFYLPQSPERLFFAETVREELAFGLKRRGTGDIESRSRAALERCGLAPGAFLDRSPFQLSFGEMRRVAFAIADSLAPSLLLLDEPASCLDAAGRGVLADLAVRRSAAGGAVMLASHDLSHLQEVSDRIVTLTRSRRADSIPANSPTRRH